MVWHFDKTGAQSVIPQSVSVPMVRALQALDNGVFAMCQDEALAWMVETSSNVASVKTEDEKVTVVTRQRSNVMSNLDNLTNSINAAFQ